MILQWLDKNLIFLDIEFYKISISSLDSVFLKVGKISQSNNELCEKS